MQVNDLTTLENIFKKYGESSAAEGEYAIMAPFVKSEGRLKLIFEVRAMSLRRQPGEVCFPGGRIEALETPQKCAVRESCEELGLSADRIRIIGNMGVIYSLLNERINVFVGEITDYDVKGLDINPSEVHKVFAVPLDFFIEKGVSDAFNYDGNYIWGLTARAVNRLLKMFREVD